MAIGERFEAIIGAACEVIARRGFHQASIRDIARAAGLSLAGLYHYVGGKPELLFLVLDRSLCRLTADLDRALAEAATPERQLRELIRTHLDFGFHHAAALKIINRDYDLLDEPQRSEVAARRQAYLARGLAVLEAIDPRGRSRDELLSATNLLLGMLNGIATRPFLRSAEDAHALALEVGALFLHGFLGRAPAGERACGDERTGAESPARAGGPAVPAGGAPGDNGAPAGSAVAPAPGAPAGAGPSPALRAPAGAGAADTALRRSA
jgi:AcrR family transcriptional regulator